MCVGWGGGEGRERGSILGTLQPEWVGRVLNVCEHDPCRACAVAGVLRLAGFLGSGRKLLSSWIVKSLGRLDLT